VGATAEDGFGASVGGGQAGFDEKVRKLGTHTGTRPYTSEKIAEQPEDLRRQRHFGIADHRSGKVELLESDKTADVDQRDSGAQDFKWIRRVDEDVAADDGVIELRGVVAVNVGLLECDVAVTGGVNAVAGDIESDCIDVQ